MKTDMPVLTPRRSALASALTLAAALALGGCDSSNKDSSMSRNSGPPRAVESSDVTHIAQQSQSAIMNFPTGDASTSVLRVEQISPQEVRANQPYTYQVKVSNLTDKPLQNVVLRSPKPEGFQSAMASDGSAAAQVEPDGSLSYNVGNLGPRESRMIQVTNTASAQGVVRTEYKVTYEQQMAAAINVTAPTLAVTKEGPKEVDICQGIDWNYTVRNTGTGVARNVALRDPLPEGLATIDGQNVVAATLGDIPAGQSRNVIGHLKAAHTGQFASAATVTSDAGTAKSDNLTTIARQPKLDIAVKGPDEEYLGKPVVYQVTVTNSGDSAAQKATLHFDSSEGAQLVSVTDANGAVASAEGNQNLGTIEAGQSRTLNATFQPTQAGVLKINAIATGQCANQAAKPSETKIMAVAALLLEAVDVADPVKVGDNVVYKIKVTNQGNGPDTNIKVTATLPDGEQFIKATGSSDATNSGQSITFAPVQSLAAKQSVTWEVTAKATKPADVQFKVTATSDTVKSPAEKSEPTKLY